MREVTMMNRISVDGYFAGPKGEIDWFIPDPEVDKAVHAGVGADTALFGRTTYELFESYWPKIETDLRAPEEARKTAKELTEMTKIVFSKTLKTVTWKNSKLFSQNLNEEVRKLKQEDGSGIVIFGSGTIVQQLSDSRLIDDYFFIVTPVILGKGKSLFQGINRLNLKLTETKHFESGNVLLHYKPDVQSEEEKGLVAKASISITAPIDKVWSAFTSPETIKLYMFGTTVVSDWTEGGPIVWKGEWQGREYEDKGVILKLEPKHLIKYTHFSPLSGKQDLPENYHKVTVELTAEDSETLVALSQDNNENEEERKHSESNWKDMLKKLKALLEM